MAVAEGAFVLTTDPACTMLSCKHAFALSTLGLLMMTGCADGSADDAAQDAPEQVADTESRLEGCSVSSGAGRSAEVLLGCNNKPGVKAYEQATPESRKVNVFRSAHSWFNCWGRGVRHAGGNDTWYATADEDADIAGFVPAVNLDTTSEFNANPARAGLPICRVCNQKTGRCPTLIDYN